jgi:Na+/H+-dicarboxylate symporter
MCRTAVNITGDAACAVIIEKGEESGASDSNEVTA